MPVVVARHHSASDARANCAPAPEHLVGRERALEQLRHSAERATAEPTIALVSGEAGIGKTHLVDAFAAEQRSAGALVLIGGSVELSGDPIPYAPVAEILRSLHRRADLALDERTRRDLDTLLAGHGDPVGGRAEFFERVLRVLDSLTRTGRGLVVVFEDVHWSDASTLDLIAFLFRNRSPQQVLILTFRDDDLDARPGLRELLSVVGRGRVTQRVQLSRLSRAEVAELVHAQLGVPATTDEAEQIFARSEGNPFIAAELACAPDRDHLPATVQDVLLARTARLGRAAGQIVQVAAVTGRPVTHEFLAAASGLSGPSLLAALHEVVASGLFVVDPSDGDYKFRHVMTADAIVGRLLPGERRMLHDIVAAALGADPESSTSASRAAETAAHWYAARRMDRALPASVAAGRMAAEVYAYSTAWLHLRRAVDLMDSGADAPDPAFARELLRDAAEAARWNGDIAAALTLVERAREFATGAYDLAELFERTGQYLWDEGHTEEARRSFDRAHDLLAGAPPSTLSATVAAAVAHIRLLAGHHEAIIAPAREAIELAARVDAHAAQGRAQVSLGMALCFSGIVGEGADLVRAGQRLIERWGDLDDRRRATSNLSFALSMAGHTGEACDVAVAGIELIRRYGLDAAAGAALTENAIVLLRLTGRWAEALELSDELLGRELPTSRATYAHLARAELDIATGRLPEARVRLDTAWRLIEGHDLSLLSVDLHLAEAELAAAHDDGGRALGSVRRALAALPNPAPAGLETQILALGLRVAGRDEAHDLHQRLEGFDAASATPEVAANCLSGAAHRERDPVRAAQLWSRAAAAWQELDRPPETAYCVVRQAEALLRARQTPRLAAAQLRRGYHIAQALPAAALMARAEDVARRARIDLTADDPKPEDALGRFGLTAREREVLDSMTLGLSNKEIAERLYLSHRTVGVHVSNVLRKMQVSTRGQAVAVAARATAAVA